MGWIANLIQKLNPMQPLIVEEQGETHSTKSTISTFQNAYTSFEIVNRGCNLIADSAAAIDIDVGAKLSNTTMNAPKKMLRKERVKKLLNNSPNPYISINEFRRNIIIDLLIDGNAFIFFDGAFLYNLPAASVDVIADKKTFVSGYKYAGTDVPYSPEQVIHIRDNSFDNIFRGTSRLVSTEATLTILTHMLNYQSKFFENNAMPGLVMESDRLMSEKSKLRKILEWKKGYSISRGGAKNPIILDGGLKIAKLANEKYSELDFAAEILTKEEKILKALGVPPILLDTGNNANISPNLRLFYLTTIMPLVDKYISAFERFFSYDMKPITQDIQALRPELKDLANYLTSLVNAGIMTRNEARDIIRLEASSDEIADTLILPANVAGSASNSNVGGAPSQQGNDNNAK